MTTGETDMSALLEHTQEDARDESASPPTRVLIADDHPLVIAGIRRTIEDAEDIEIVGEAQSAPQLLALAERRQPDVVLMDLRMPGANGVEAIEQLREIRPDVKIVVISASDDRTSISASLRAGASAYLVKTAIPSDIQSVVRQVARGAVFLAAPSSPVAAEHPREPAASPLSDRERSVLAAVASGMTTAEVSRELWISEHTVKFHLTNIYRKLGVANRAKAVRYAIEAGLTE
jgi:DNA-binding NarL/FixJ family response regulator